MHAEGSYIYLQLFAFGRGANPEALREEDPGYDYVAPSPIPLKSKVEIPRELTKEGSVLNLLEDGIKKLTLPGFLQDFLHLGIIVAEHLVMKRARQRMQ